MWSGRRILLTKTGKQMDYAWKEVSNIRNWMIIVLKFVVINILMITREISLSLDWVNFFNVVI